MVTFSEFKTWFLSQLLMSYALIVSGLIVNFLQLLTFIIIRPFNKLLYKRIIYYLSYSLYANLTSIAQWWSGSELIIYMKDEDFKMFGKENSLCVSNHKYDVDWMVGLLICQNFNLLGGSKVVMKDSLKYIPIFGWSWMFGEYIFVKRIWETDHKSLVSDLKSILEFPKDLFYSITVFCEGTRFTQEKYEESMKIAKEKGLPILKHHLLPRAKGFNLIAGQLAQHIDYLYDLNIAIDPVNGKPPSLSHIKDGIPLRAHVYVRRMPMSIVPVDDDKKCTEFIQKLYQEKDEIYDVYYKNGDFCKLGAEKHVMKRNRYDLYISIFWLVVTLIPSFYYLFNMLWNGSWLFKISFLAICFLVNFSLKWIITTTSSKNASKFGLPTKKVD